ncbi:MAG: hypothetical protein WDN47_05505 [Candidatus Doudnabacteria bacterium]
MEWEEIKCNSHFRMYRAKVHGGWMVFVSRLGDETAAFFYPDLNHKWDGKTLS